MYGRPTLHTLTMGWMVVPMGQSDEQPVSVVRPISVLAVNDHPLLLDGIAALAGRPDM